MSKENEKYLKDVLEDLNEYVVPTLEKDGIVYFDDPNVKQILGSGCSDKESRIEGWDQ